MYVYFLTCVVPLLVQWKKKLTGIDPE